MPTITAMSHTTLRISLRLLLPVLLGVVISQQPAHSQSETEPVPALNHHLDASQERPIPYPVMPPPAYHAAVEREERTMSGRPGSNYWTNYTHYDIDATLSPSTHTLRAEETITYINRSPDSLRNLMVHLRQNFYKEGVVRNRNTHLTGGMNITIVRLDGQPLVEFENTGEKAGYRIDGTLMNIKPAANIAPGDTVRLHFQWSFKVPPEDGYRMGQDGEVFYLGYWYPQMAVYDDIHGWVAEPYMGDGEFYMGYADYDLSYTLPQGWLVSSTGALANADSVLTSTMTQRLKRASDSDSTITIVKANERKPGVSTQTRANGMLTWKFSAKNVRDVAFGASNRFVWDATSAQVNSDRRTMIHAFYRPDKTYWDRAAEFTKYAIEDLSKQLSSYPWPHMSAIEGIIGGGMEYPMITLIGSHGSYRSVFGTVYHEVAHMWYPMMVGTNEKAYAWMDEGLVTYLTNEAEADYWGGAAWMPGQSYYYYLAGTDQEVPVMRHADLYPTQGPSRVLASYSKPGLLMNTLKGIIGEQKFGTAMKAFVDRWKYKHPTPYDLFNTFEDIAGEDLDWFWTPAFFETWTLDQKIEAVRQTVEGVELTIRDLGLMPMPVFIQAVYADGSTVERRLPVDVWLEGKRTVKTTLQAGEVTKVQLDPQFYTPDLDFSNNIWEATDSASQTQ